MIAFLAAALLAAQPLAQLTVASPRGERQVAVVSERGFPALAAAAFAAALGQDAPPRPSPSGAAALSIQGRQFEFVLDAAYFRHGGRVYTLAGGGYVARDSLFVPLQWAVEYLPQFVPRLRYDPARHRLEELPEAPRLIVRGSDAPPPRGVVMGETPRPGTAAARRRHIVAIDPGHGGVDPGMQGPIGRTPFLFEKDVTFAIARALERELTARGVGVVMTRTRDTLISRSDRGRIAGQAGAHLLVSIHVNAANPGWRNARGARGFETYFLGEALTEDARRVARMEEAVVRFETDAAPERGDPLRFILNDLAQNEHLRESSRLAQQVHGEVGRVHPSESRGVKQAPFTVLYTSYMPAILIETGFGSNEADARYLVSDAGQRRLARAIAGGVERYLADYDRRLGVTP